LETLWVKQKHSQRFAMTALGNFSQEALEMFQLAASEQSYEFSEGDTYDFTRCVRPDGSAYGTGGKCRQGTESGAKKAESKPAPVARKALQT
jgi:hypothetical protein